MSLSCTCIRKENMCFFYDQKAFKTLIVREGKQVCIGEEGKTEARDNQL